MFLEQQLRLARRALSLYDAAADRFIQKVDSGRARSVETYRQLKEAREASRTAWSADRRGE